MTHSLKFYNNILHVITWVILIQLIPINRGIAQIELETTVAVNPHPEDNTFDICGTEHSIVVDQGTPIKFCFKVTNLGSHPYLLQDAFSPHFGNTLESFPFTLQPGASVFVTEGEVVTSTVVFDGTWTAHNSEVYPSYKIENINNDFVDISATGTGISIGDDDDESDVTMEFDFVLNGIFSKQLTIGSNGAMRFGELGAQISNLNQALSLDSDENIIAPMWDDLISSTNGRIYYQTFGAAPDRIFIVEWSDFSSFNLSSGSSPGTATFEVKLFESSNTIEFHYQDVVFDDTTTDNGKSATVGIGGDSGAIQHSYNEAVLSNATALSFSRIHSADYTIRYSNDANGPVYDFVDISSTGTALGLGDDGEANVTMDFDLFLSNYSSKFMTIGNNGAIRFGQLNTQIFAGNNELINDMAGNIIAPFWDDLSAQTGDVYYQTIGTAPNRVFIVQWNNRPHFASGAGVGEVTFEVKLFEDSNIIEFHYEDVLFDDLDYDDGQSATIGVGGSINAAQFSYDSAQISNHTAISFVPKARSATDSDSANVIVNVPDINVAASLATNLFDSNPMIGFNLSFDNLGTFALNWDVDDCGTDIGWLTIDGPTSGTLTSGNTGSFHLTISAVGYEYGTYVDDICINSNDPDEATVNIPITMHYIDRIFMNGFE